MQHLRWAILGFGATLVFAACGSSGNTPGHGGNTGTAGATGTGGHTATASGTGGDVIIIDDGGTGDAACATAVTCAQAGANCGPISDGCGGILQCGDCPAGEGCGVGPTASVCAKPPCAPTTCAALGFDCGPAGDGCGLTLDCGTCPSGQTCGGGGSSKCGTISVCTPKTCADQGFNCGPAGDGCGNNLDCGSCTGVNSCGGGGVPGVCGAPVCVPKTCATYGAKACGPLADGCGGLLQCGGCSLPEACGGLVPSTCGIPASCTGLCQQQVSCPSGGTTSVTGTVYAPNGTDPLPNVLVYVPNAPVQPFAPGVHCDNCSTGVSGSPLVSAATDVQGKFTLTNVPVGANIPLVIQTGRWRRQITVPTVTACQANAVSAANTRLPRNKTEGDIPQMAMVTGSVDVLECVLRKIGVADSEFTAASGAGRIHLYQGDGTVASGGKTYHIGGATIGGATDEATLVGNSAKLAQYDMVLFGCKGAQHDRTTAEQQNVINYANAGGRVFATHFGYVYLYNDAPFSSTASWNPGQCDPFTSLDGCVSSMGYPPDQNGVIDQSFPKGQALAQWLQFIGASSALGQIPINTLRWDLNGVNNPPAQQWMKIADSNIGDVPMHLTFNTPIGAAADQQCGRVLFDDFHVENHGFINQGSAYNLAFPSECAAGAMTAQEKLLEFMIFDLGSCVAPDVPTCTKSTCAGLGFSCGPAGDGCGGLLDCGTCPSGQTCGGGGMPSVCGTTTCAVRTCAQQNLQCGPAGDGCGHSLDCGTCPSGQTCGGGGTPGVCGAGTCNPTTCAAQNLHCGPAGDGCGHALDCGACPPGQTCGGGGTPGVCGSSCVPRTCVQLGYNCGPAGDGCGGTLQCGTCSAPQTCGGGGTPNVCGGSVPG
jgi:hypothetical protein